MKTFRYFFFALIAAIIPVSLSQAQGWQWQNPLPHGLIVNDAVVLEGYLALAVCENGYVMRSGDVGKNWVAYKLGDGNLTDLTVTPSGRVFAVGEDEIVYFSDDMGGSWQKRTVQPGTRRGSSEIVMADDNNGVAFMGFAYLHRTTDGGNTWEYIDTPLTANEVGSSLSFQPPQTLWIRTNQSVFSSSDFGSNWVKRTEYDPESFQRFVFVDSLYGYQCNYGSLYRTTNGGNAWQEMDIFGFGFVLNVLAGGVMGNTVVCLSEGSYVVNISTDRGDTWNVSLTEEAFENTFPVGVAFGNERYGIVTGGGGRILRTTDGGSSWAVVHGIGFLGRINDVAFTSEKNGFALTSSPTVLMTTNGGERWQETIPDPTVVFEQAEMYSPTAGYAIGRDEQQNYVVYHVEESGTKWTKRGNFPLPYDNMRYLQPRAIRTTSKDTIWVGVSYGLLYHSVDGGVHWDSLLVDESIQYQYYTGFGVFTFPPNTVIYPTSSGNYTSYDGGETWTFRLVSGNRYTYQTQFLSPTHGFVVAGTQIGRTTDGGDVWTFGERFDYELMHFFNKSTGVAYLSSYNNSRVMGSIEWTHDGGETWSLHPLNERMAWNAWFWYDQQTAWAYGYDGLIRATTNQGIADAAPPLIATAFRLEQNYPNPFSLTQDVATTIAFSLPEGVHRNVTLTLRDALGREVSRLVEGSMQGGRHYVTLGRQHFGPTAASGVYYYSLETGGSLLTRKIVVMR